MTIMRNASDELAIDVSARDGSIVLNLRGLLGEGGSELLVGAVQSLLDEHDQRIVIDLESVRALDMSGARAIIDLCRSGMGIADRLRIVGASASAYELLARTGVVRLVSVTPRDGALRHRGSVRR
jgi:anti-anti-sigma factor